MNAKKQILDALRASSIPETPLPDTDGPWTTYPDPTSQFCSTVEAVGGCVVRAADAGALQECLKQIEVYRNAENVWSRLAGVESRGRDWDTLDDPHQLECLDVCIVPCHFGVAENGAVWFTDELLRHRAALLITQHLVLAIPADQIVHNMHDAYARIALDPIRFGMFISGPSKTADIEQSLVIGAHGPRSLTVILQ